MVLDLDCCPPNRCDRKQLIPRLELSAVCSLQTRPAGVKHPDRQGTNRRELTGTGDTLLMVARRYTWLGDTNGYSEIHLARRKTQKYTLIGDTLSSVIHSVTHTIRGLEGQRVRGPEGQRARGPKGQRAKGPEGQRARGSEGQSARGPDLGKNALFSCCSKLAQGSLGYCDSQFVKHIALKYNPRKVRVLQNCFYPGRRGQELFSRHVLLECYNEIIIFLISCPAPGTTEQIYAFHQCSIVGCGAVHWTQCTLQSTGSSAPSALDEGVKINIFTRRLGRSAP
jgi:hypothetical protein